jgi:hypothetical protein
MLIRCGYDISFQSDTRTAMMAMLSLHPSRHQDLQTAQRLMIAPDIPLYQYEDAFGNVATRFTVPPGGVTLSCDFVIQDSGEPDRRAPGGLQMPVEELPDDVMIFLLGSRYCETDRLMDVPGPISPTMRRRATGSTRSSISSTTISSSVTTTPGRTRPPGTAIRSDKVYAATSRTLPLRFVAA